MNRLLIIGLVICLIGFSCQESQAIYQSSHEIDGGDWYWTDTLEFQIEIVDTKTLYDLSLLIEHTDLHPYENLYLRIQTEYPDGKVTVDETNFDLANDEGQWYGKCKGAKCKAAAELQSSFRFRQAGSYSFAITPHLRTNPLRSIKSIGLMLDEHRPDPQD